MNFEIRCTPHIIVKQGAVKEMESYIKGMGSKYLLVSDPFFFDGEISHSIIKQVQDMGCEIKEVSAAPGEPTVEGVDEIFDSIKDYKADCVIGFGGGSTLDTSKILCIMYTNGAPCIDYLEYVGIGKKVENTPLPLISIPTTSGTGTEVGNVCVLCSHEQNFKRSVRNPGIIPKIAIIDPDMVVNCPATVTAFSGLDALAHNLESYSSHRSTPASEMYALKGIELAGKYLVRAYKDPHDIEARQGMCMCSAMGGLALMNAGVGAAHGVGMAVGIEYGLSHGEAVGIALPHVMELNMQKVPERIDVIGEALTGKRFDKPGEAGKAGVAYLKDMIKQMNVKPDFKHLGTDPSKMDYFAHAIQGNSLNGNPLQMEESGWAEFLKGIL